ncbi:lytic transglycosylase domain-containing protein [Burkholderia ubonensis]|uniref:lytic transglycosylase domain-containing protein n=1 Tax=Burkholderia ubonensis TaxID=101571 RepID=UPI0012F87CCD|nr:transglycosylase SLT domain-containing protein [Burkholderia ubonensis]
MEKLEEEMSSFKDHMQEIGSEFLVMNSIITGNKFSGAIGMFGKIATSTAKSWKEIGKEIEKSTKGMSMLARLSINTRAFGGLTLAASAGAIGAAFGITTASMFGLSDVNKTSRSLGLKPGQEQAFEDVYGPAGGDRGLLSRIAGVQADPTKWRYLQAAGISPEEIQSKDVTGLAAEFLEKAGGLYKQRGGMYAEAMGLTNIADLSSLRLAGSYGKEDFSKFAQQEQEAEKRLAVDQPAADAATEFTKALKAAADEVENSFMVAFIPLAPAFKDLTKSIADSLASTFKSAEFKADLEGVAEGFKTLFHALGWLAKTEKPAVQNQAQLGSGLVQVAKDIKHGDFAKAWHDLNKPLPGPQPNVIGSDSPNPIASPTGGAWAFNELSSMQRGISHQQGKWDDVGNKYNLPRGLLAAVEQIESRGNPRAVSPVGASGPFQIMPSVGKHYGLSQDDLFDPRKSASVAAQELGMHLKKYVGDIGKALAAYNWGQGNLDKDIAAHGDKWRNFLPKETAGYLNKAQAMGVNVNVNVTAPAGSSTNVTAAALTQ